MEDPPATHFERLSPPDDDAHRCITKLENTVPGILGAALVDQTRGLSIRAVGSTVDMQLAATGGAELLALQMGLLAKLGLEGSLEDILTVTDLWFWVIRPLDSQRFLYVIVDRVTGNLALARRLVSSAAAELLAAS